MSLSSNIQATLQIDPAATALEFEERGYRWGQIAEVVDGLERALRDGAIPRGAAIGLLLRNRPEMAAAILGTIVGERCIVCVNPMQGEAKLAEDLAGLRVPALVATEADWQSPVVRQAAEASGSLGIHVCLDGAPAVSLVPGLEKPAHGSHRDLAPGIAVEMLTSGTTGPPKRIQLGTAAFEQAIVGSSHYEKNRSEAPKLYESFALLNSPLVHIGGMFHAVKAAVDGRPLCLLDRFSVAGWTAAVRRHRPKVTGLVPSAMKMVLDANVPVEDLASLRAVTSGTAPLAPELQVEFEERYGIPVLITYGATEFAGAVAGWTIQDHRAFAKDKRGSVGRAHPGCSLRIVDAESGEPLAADEVGLLEVQTEQAPTREWVRTADRARLDPDGFLWIEGRADGAINRGGFKVDPASVARALEGHPAIREAAVVGLPDERLGEVPAALVELREGAAAPSEAELIDFAKDRLTRYFVPVRIRVVDEIPRTPSLKPSQPGMRALFAEEEASGR